METRTIFFYDGDCGFCSRSVQLLLDHSDPGQLYFCALQSPMANEVFRQLGRSTDLASSYLYLDGTLHQYSSAVLKAFTLCRAPLCWLAALRYFPRALRDFFYLRIANNRYWISRLMPRSCRIPTADERERFLDSKQPSTSATPTEVS